MAARKEGGQPNNKNAEKWTEEEAIILGNELVEWIKKPGNFWVQTFFTNKDLYATLTNYLADKYESFSRLKDVATEIQETKIVENGLKGDFNASMSMFVLKNKHKYKDKTEVDSNVKLDYDGFLNDIKPPIED